MYKVNKKEGSVPGLKFVPTLEPEHSDELDSIVGVTMGPGISWGDGSIPSTSPANQNIVSKLLKKHAESVFCIVEIGVMSNPEPEHSFTHILTSEKPIKALYLGVDTSDKSGMDNPDLRIHTIRANSSDFDAVMTKLKSLDAMFIDLLLIDGFHSVKQCIDDWRYTRLLSPGGVVIMHDTNSHPGPYAVFDAIDETLYRKKKFCTDAHNDFGVGVVWRK